MVANAIVVNVATKPLPIQLTLFCTVPKKETNGLCLLIVYIKGYSLRKSAQIVGVTWVTPFYWRHKLLNALKQIDFEQFDGIVEVDENYFLYSQKGQRDITERKPLKRGDKSKYRGISHEQVCVLVARDRA